MFVVNSQECYNKLELSNPKKIYKCQLSASSAAKRETGPYNIRKHSKKGWSPALRLGPHKPYFQIDFLRNTRVSRLEFIKVADTRSVTKYRLQYSHTGSDWLYANEVTELTYKKNGEAIDTLEKPIQTRFVRVIIEEAEKGEEDTKYIGLKMEMYGCFIGEKLPSVTCAKTDPTWYSDDKNKYG
ncbi:Neuropilin-1, partial [Stegodyphus mimosarum]